MTTSNRTYIKMLGACGVSAQKLPLFGNIAVARRDEALPSASRALLASRVSFDLNQRDSYWLVLFFGTLHPEWKPEPVLSIIHRAAIAVKRRVCFVALGRLGAAGEEKWSLMAERYAASFSFVAMGEQEAGTLSQLFQEADFGIAASPWQLIGKSGSAAAMLEHGLPVIANRDDWRARHIDGEDDTPDPLLHRCDNSLEKKLIAGLPKRRPMGGAQEVARQFVKSLCPENA